MPKTLLSLAIAAVISAIMTQPAAHADTPLWDQADVIFGEDAMTEAREELLAEGGTQSHFYIAFNQLEWQSTDDGDSFVWNGQANWGGDIHKLWLKSEGHASLEGDGIEDAEVQLLYSRAVSPFWNVQTGLRYDIEPDGLVHGVVALNGLAPYRLEVDASAFLSEEGDLTARIEAEYELLLTQRLILQPRIEANLAAQDIAEREIGAGLASVDAGLRLRYEIKREFAPYLGVEWQNAFGDTKDYIEAGGGEAENIAVLAGLRVWY